MTLMIDLQIAVADAQIPAREQFQRWADAASAACRGDKKELTIRITDLVESEELNHRYRNKQGPTNVLSFPFEDPPGLTTNMLGDLVICAPIVEAEAVQQHKAVEAHWAHILIHGVLHLCGYDHIDPDEADQMEALETDILAGLGFPPPYAEEL